MGSLALGFKILSAFSFLLMVVGLYKPWIVLWWEDTQYRLKVIRIYGLTGLISWLAGMFINFIS